MSSNSSACVLTPSSTLFAAGVSPACAYLVLLAASLVRWSCVFGGAFPCLPDTGIAKSLLVRKSYSVYRCGRSLVLALVLGRSYLSGLATRCHPSKWALENVCCTEGCRIAASMWKVLYEIVPLTVATCNTYNNYKWRILEGKIILLQLVYSVHIWQRSVYSQLHNFLG